ncbi:MAG TPA: HEAT repeat domain-containing protein [Planctomycetota bacterium]|nr:HEAT repeat domain-containing protein [Planctomycetota bacterium]
MSEPLIDTLLEMLKSPDLAQRRAAIMGLGTVSNPTPSVARGLIDLLLGEDEALVSDAIRALGLVRPVIGEAVREMLDDLRSAEPSRRLRGAWHLAFIGSSQSFESGCPEEVGRLLLESIRDPDPELRRPLCHALGSWGVEPQRALPALSERLEDESSDVRASACSAIGRYTGAAVSLVPTLAARLRDPDPWVRERATRALEEVFDTHRDASNLQIPAVPAEDAEAPPPSPGTSAQGGGSPTVRELLCGLLQDADFGCVLAALQALSRLAPLSAEEIEAIRALKSHADDQVRIQAGSLLRLATRQRPGRS